MKLCNVMKPTGGFFILRITKQRSEGKLIAMLKESVEPRVGPVLTCHPYEALDKFGVSSSFPFLKCYIFWHHSHTINFQSFFSFLLLSPLYADMELFKALRTHTFSISPICLSHALPSILLGTIFNILDAGKLLQLP